MLTCTHTLTQSWDKTKYSRRQVLNGSTEKKGMFVKLLTCRSEFSATFKNKTTDSPDLMHWGRLFQSLGAAAVNKQSTLNLKCDQVAEKEGWVTWRGSYNSPNKKRVRCVEVPCLCLFGFHFCHISKLKEAEQDYLSNMKFKI